MPPPPDAAPAGGHFSELFERARRALVELGGLRAEALDGPAAGGIPSPDGTRVAAQLRLDERTREVVVRFVDVQTGATIRELPPRLVAATAARLRATPA